MIRRWISIATIGVISALFSSPPAAAQNEGKPGGGKPPVPRAADGKPDMSGVWQGGGAAGLAFAIGSENAKTARPSTAGVAAAPAIRRDPAPYQDWVQPKLKELRDRRLIDDPSARCLLVGVPRITAMPLPIQIVQTPGQIVFLYETFHAFRVIPTDGRKHPDDIDPSFMGDSVARWEGDTLVVDVIGFNDKTWIGAGSATIHSDALHVIERYTRVDYDTINYEVSIEDPKVFTKIWSLAPSFLSLRAGERLHEYECIENNEDLLRFEKLLENPSLFRRQP
jgi:hypothetical protein